MYVHIIGAGLIGGSVALGLAHAGLEVSVSDISRAAEQLSQLGHITSKVQSRDPDLVFVCTPPIATATEVCSALKRFPKALVVDVASVKSVIYDEVSRETSSGERARYVQSHPMVGREIGGLKGARGDLFLGWPWIVCNPCHCRTQSMATGCPTSATNHPGTHPLVEHATTVHSTTSGHHAHPEQPSTEPTPPNIDKLLHCISLLGAFPVFMDQCKHDHAVAVVSHVPHIISSLTALLLSRVDQDAMAICGSGLQSMTRLAASNPDLWTQIISANSCEILHQLKVFSQLVKNTINTLENLGTPESQRDLFSQLAAAQLQQARIPKKPGKRISYSQLEVVIPDKPGELSKVLHIITKRGINLEDLHFEHANNFGVVKLSVSHENRDSLINILKDKWTLIT